MSALYNLDMANASDAGIPGEAVEADPFGALAAMEAQDAINPGSVTQSPVATAVVSSSATTDSVAGFLTSTFNIGSYQVPYWAAGLGILGAAVLFSGHRRGAFL